MDGTLAFTSPAGEFKAPQSDARAWSTVLDIGPDWRELRIPFGALRYFSQWPHVPPFKEGVASDARKMVVARFMYGNWISGGTADQAHGFEIESFRIVGR